MDASESPDEEPNPPVPNPGRRDLRRAWIWVVLVPTGFATAMLFGEWTMSLAGFPSGVDSWLPALPQPFTGQKICVRQVEGSGSLLGSER